MEGLVGSGKFLLLTSPAQDEWVYGLTSSGNYPNPAHSQPIA